MLKKFHLFTFPDYYPSGGANDFDGSFETLDEAKSAVPKGSSIATATIMETQEDGSLKYVLAGDLYDHIEDGWKWKEPK